MTKLYIDLDDTVKDTTRYIKRMVKSNSMSLKGKRNLLFNMIGEDFYIKEALCNWDAIPFREGSISSLKILETEYDLVFCSQYLFKEEAESKKKFAEAFGKEIYLFDSSIGEDKDSLDMSDGYLVDDNIEVLKRSNAVKLYEMFNEQKGINYSIERPENSELVSWYSLVDKLVGGGNCLDADVGRYVYSGIQK